MLFYSVNFDVDGAREAQVLDRIARQLIDIGAAGIPHAAPPMTLKLLTFMIRITFLFQLVNFRPLTESGIAGRKFSAAADGHRVTAGFWTAA